MRRLIVIGLFLVILQIPLRSQDAFERGVAVRIQGRSCPASVKIVAIPGDGLRMDKTGIYVNDQAVGGLSSEFTAMNPKMDPTVVPAGHYFVAAEERNGKRWCQERSLFPAGSLVRVAAK